MGLIKKNYCKRQKIDIIIAVAKKKLLNNILKMKNARNKYEKLPEEEKEVKREYGKNRYKKNEKKKTKQKQQKNKQTNKKTNRLKYTFFA